MSDILRGKKIFISASLPSDHRSPKFSVDREHLGWVEDAVIATARAVFEHGGRLVMGGHPSIVPLVAIVAGEYAREPDLVHPVHGGIRDDVASELSSPPIDVFQSRAYAEYLPTESSIMCEAGLARIHWVESCNGERFSRSKLGERQCEESLRTMREKLLTSAKPTAMVGIGGMEDLREEFNMFLEICHGSVFLFRSTGGMARILAEESQRSKADSFLPAGLAAQSTLRRYSSSREFDRKTLERVQIVEFLIEGQVGNYEQDWVEEFREYRNRRFAHSEALMAEINPPYDFFMKPLVKEIAEID